MAVDFGNKFGRGLNRRGQLGQKGRDQLVAGGIPEDKIGEFEQFSLNQGSGLNRKNVQDRIGLFNQSQQPKQAAQTAGSLSQGGQSGFQTGGELPTNRGQTNAPTSIEGAQFSTGFPTNGLPTAPVSINGAKISGGIPTGGGFPSPIGFSGQPMMSQFSQSGGAQTAAGQAPQSPAQPESPLNSNQTIQQTNINALGQQGKQAAQIGAGQIGQGGQNVGAGAGGVTSAINRLQGLTDDFGNTIAGIRQQGQDAQGRFGGAADQTLDFLTSGFQGNVDPRFIENARANKEARDALIRREFSGEGATGRQLGAQQRDLNALLASRGIASSTSADAGNAELQARREALENQALLGSQQRLEDQVQTERGRVTQAGLGAGGTSSSFANVLSNAALGQGGLANQLSGQQLAGTQAGGQLAEALGKLGINLSQLGGQNLQTGLNAQNQAVTQNLNALGLEGSLRQAEKVLQSELAQQVLNNLTQNKQNKEQQRILNEIIIPQLMQPSGGGSGGGPLGFLF